MDDQEWLNRLRKVFSPSDPAIKELESLIDEYQRNQERNLAYYLSTDLKAPADQTDKEAIMNVLRQLSEETVTEAQRAVLSALIDNSPNYTNADLAKLNSRANVAEMGLMIGGALAVLKDQIYQRVMNLEGRQYKGYNPQLRRKALFKTAVKAGKADDDLPTIFKHMQSLSIDLDNVIDYQVQNHMNPHSLGKASEEALQVKKWKGQTEESYRKAKANAKRIFLTEGKATQIKETAKFYRSKGYSRVKVVSRHNTHVCRFCEGMDGTIVKVNSEVIGVNVPPFHPNCQCNIIPMQEPYKY